MGKYDDIINMPHHQSKTRPHMSMLNRAAQFSPFAALTGFDDEIVEEARLTDEMIELGEEDIEKLNSSFKMLQDRIKERPTVSVFHFVRDDKKQGGKYVNKVGEVKRVDEVERKIIFVDGVEIFIEGIYSIEII